MKSNFNEIKQEILRRAKEARACKFEYSRAYVTENLSELSKVIKDNFYWACAHGVLTADLVEKYKEDFSANDIYANQNVKNGYLLCDRDTVEAYGDTTVKAYGSATVKAFDNTLITVCDNVTVEAYENAYCTSYNTIDCKLFDHAIYRDRSTNTVYYADSDIKFVKQ